MASKHIEINNQSYDISYEIVNISNEKTIVFLHGWGSNKEIMKQGFKNELKDYKHIYIDMPGFGKSLNEQYILNTYEDACRMFGMPSRETPAVDVWFNDAENLKINAFNIHLLLVLLSSAGIIEVNL